MSTACTRAEAALARVDLGGHAVAVPVDRIVQAITRTPTLTALPRRGSPAVGLIPFRDTVVPLVDLRRWVAFPDAVAEDGLALVLGREGRMVAIAGSAVHGVRRVPAARLRRLAHGDDAEEVFDAAAQFDEGAPVPVLDVERLMALADTWVDPPPPGRPADEAAGTAAGRRGSDRRLPDHATFGIGEARIAVATADTRALEPMPALQPIGRGRDAFAIVEWRGAPLAVCDLATRVPGAPPLQACPYLLVLARGEHALGIGVTQPMDFAPLPPERIGALPEGLSGVPGLSGVVHREDGRPTWVVDAAALMTDTGLGAIRTTVCVAGADRRGAAGAAARRRNDVPWLVFEAAGPLCVPATDVREIVRIRPADLTAQAGGTFEWRGQRLPVTDLRGADARGAGELALVIADGIGARGLRIEAVHAIVPPGQGEFVRMTMMRESAECLFWGRGPARRTARVAEIPRGSD